MLNCLARALSAARLHMQVKRRVRRADQGLNHLMYFTYWEHRLEWAELDLVMGP